ncbi:ribonuclease E inhibitor RraB [Agrilutibacter solisilvae]|uniref:Ribonuclease E inhibitor RraB n=1 Tax=Agrilutibacter solisilvae TaxID=2763317 RepID=A0A975AT97_9GAMM|nr:ribonuclease E inhibitor RraB [Lysobacter solisilvae]QSX78775.1 ribonuclease E inhibitor RraB [Lysobacter solisilvae]
MITRDQLDTMFESMATNTDWDLSAPLLWGYFFTDASPEKLAQAAPLLEAQGYTVVDIFQTETDEPQEQDLRDLWWLHVEKVEVHTAKSLDARNQALYAFAAEHGLGAYDGMDVSPPAMPH